MSTELLPPQEAQLAAQPSPITLLAGADLSAIDTDKMSKLMEMQERWEAREAVKALNRSIVTFQSLAPSIYKGRDLLHLKAKYASLDDVMDGIQPLLTQCNLAITFDMEQTDKTVTAVCHVIHADGAEKVARGVAIPVEAANRGMSAAQAAACATTFAKRNALNAAMGITYTDVDNDAQAMPEYVSEEQAAEIKRLIEQFPEGERKAEWARFSKWSGAERIKEIPASLYPKAVNVLKDSYAAFLREMNGEGDA